MKIKPATFNKNGVKRKTARLYGHFYDHNGIRRKLPLFTDMKNATEAARAVERLVSIRASGDMISAELQRFIENTRPQLRDRLAGWGIIDPSRVAAARLLIDHVADWRAFLLSEGNAPEYVDLKVSRLEAIIKACKFVQWSDIRAEEVSRELEKWRSRKSKPLSAQTSNFYLQAIRQFSKWMVNTAKRAIESPVSALAYQNVKSDRRHDRRAYSVEEFCCLLTYLQTAPVRMKIAASDRAILYQFAVETGLRSGAISKLLKSSFGTHEGSPAVYVPPGAPNKYKSGRWLVLRESMSLLMTTHLAKKMPAAKAFQFPTRGHGAKIIKADLDAARAQWIAEAATDKERQQREESNFLCYKDDQSRFLDFHAFRHTRGVFQHHNANPREVQDLLGVGSLSLVDRYTRSMKITDLAVIERGPTLLATPKTDELARVSGIDTPKSLPHSLPLRGGFRRTSPDSGESDDEPDTHEVMDHKSTIFPYKPTVLTLGDQSIILPFPAGELAERLNAPVSKTGRPARVAGVQIPHSPLSVILSPSTSALKGFLVAMRRLVPFRTNFEQTVSRI
jgi:site-specific recombinase XerD